MKRIEKQNGTKCLKISGGGVECCKRLNKFLLCIAMVVLLISGCSSNVQETTSNTSNAVQESTESMKTESEKETSEEKQSFFEQYEQALKNEGIEFEKVTMAAEYIHAKEGYKFKIGNGAVEIYSFDADSDAYKTAEENQELSMDGFAAFKATVKNGMAIIISDLDETPYLTIFDSIISQTK